MQEQFHLKVFDFDDTLFRTPNYTVSEAVGLEPYAWFDSPCSLDPKFGTRGIANTLEQVNDPLSTSVLVTHRVEECRQAVLRIVEEQGLNFNEVHFLGRGSTKASCVLNMIDGSSIKKITIYEDTLWEVISYAKAFHEAGIQQEVDFFFIDKSKVIKIDSLTALLLSQPESYEKLKLV